MKAIQLLVNSQLPPDLRDYSRSMDAKSISNLMADVARKYPEQYERISKSVSDIGRNAAYIQGETLTLNDNKPVIDLHAILKEMDDEVDAARKSTPDKDEFEAKRNSIWEKFNERIDKDTSSAALAKGNNLAYSVVSGARGKSQQLKMMISTPGLYTDAQDDLVPIFVRNSFGEGLRPAEYLASTYGARKSVLCLHEDTLVRKPDGASVAIKDIQVDDVVMGADIQSNKMPVSVVAIYKQGRQPVNKYIFRKAGSNAVRSVTCTENHKFLATTVNGVEVLPIKDIIYSNILLLDGAVWRLTDVEEVGLRYCYDIEVDNEDHLFVLESGIIVSNSTKRATAKGGDLCLVKGTSVRMADGTEKNIEDILVGDMVLGCSTAGVATPVRVINTFYQGHKQTYDIHTTVGVVACTMSHKFLFTNKENTEGNFIAPIIDCEDSTGIVTSNGSNVDILHIVGRAGLYECYDIEVAHPDHLFVLANGIVTSNSKQMTQSAAHIVVSENDCGVGNGIALDMDDRSVRGRVLAREVGGLPAGTALDRDAMAALRRKGVSKVIARSAMTCQSKEGVCSKCLGLNALGKFPMRGESVGITAANSIGEPICIHEDTLVRMADWSTKKIKDILPGDMVLGSDINAHITPVKVVNVFHNGIRPGYRTVVKKGKGHNSELIELLSTKEHKILSYQGPKGTTPVPSIQPIESKCAKHIVFLAGDIKTGNVTSQEPIGDIDTWDIEVDNETHLFVLANDMVVSNTQGALNCLVENTKVLMADYSEKNIQDVQVGDIVMGSDIKGNTSPTKVTHVWDQGMQPAQRRAYRLGQTQQHVYLESTAIHPVLSVIGNSDIPEKLIAGYALDDVSVIFPKDNLTGGTDDPWAVIMGAYLGDGIRWNSNPTACHHVTFSCADDTEIVDLNNTLAQFNVHMIKCGRSYDWRIVLKSDDQSAYKDKRGKVLPGYRNPVKRKLVEWGLADKYAHEKRVPSCVWSWSKESVAAFMAGFIATDGCIYKDSFGNIGISFSSCSKEMMEDIHRLLKFKLCVYPSSLTKTGKAGENNHIHDMWQFTIMRVEQVRRMYDLIQKYIPGVKRERFKEYMDNPVPRKNKIDTYYKGKRNDTLEVDLGMQHCYDITVDNDDSLFVLSSNIIIRNTKHTGGAAGANRRFAGFPVINQFVQSPEVFPDKAVVSTIDGTVSSIMDAPQGGFYVTVNNEPHYVPPGYPAIVKVGDKVEAGDIMTQGLPDPGDVVDYKGLGAGRKYYADKLKELLDDSGMEADRRNTELMARAALDHVQITGVPDDESGYIPDDVISYSSLSNTYVPPTNTTKGPTKKFIGSYLQAPALHYTIGTKITPKLSKELDDLGYGDVYASPTEPVFKAIMPRLRSAAHNNTDWLASMHTSYLKKQISESAIRGEDTNIESNTHFAPRLAIGANFGDNITQTGKF